MKFVLLLNLIPLLALAFSAPSSPRSTVLVTGGAGYIGSHTCVELLKSSRQVIILDDLSNSCTEAISRIRSIADASTANVVFREGDVRDSARVEEVLAEFPSISSCIHFAGLKAVGESVSLPLSYYDNNISGAVTLLKALERPRIQSFHILLNPTMDF